MSQLSDKIGQFTTVPESIIERWTELGSEAILVFLYLRYRTNRKRGSAYPSYETIEQDTGLHPRKISRGIKSLEEADLLTRRKRFGKPTIYVLQLPEPPDIGGDSSSTMEETHESSTDSGDSSSSTMEEQSFHNGSAVLPTVEEKPDREEPEGVKPDRVNEQQQIAAVLISEEDCDPNRAQEIARWASKGAKLGKVKDPPAWARKAARDEYTEPHWYESEADSEEARRRYVEGEFADAVEH